jgi:hypothetical protein
MFYTLIITKIWQTVSKFTEIYLLTSPKENFFQAAFHPTVGWQSKQAV